MMYRTLHLLLGLALLSSLACAQGAKDEKNPIIEEFRKYFRSPEPEVRRDQVERLAKVNSKESVQLLISKGLRDDVYSVREKAIWALSRVTDQGAMDELFAAVLAPKAETREGVVLAIGAMTALDDNPMGRTAVVRLLTSKLGTDRSELVRSAIAESLGMLGDVKAAAALITALNDKAERVVISAVDSLGILKAPEGGRPLIPLLQHGSWRVQVAALRALGRIRIKESIGPIIDYLASATGRPTEDARNALVKITQRTFGMNATTWREWWDRNQSGWEVPPEGKPKTEKEVGNAGYGRKPTRYHRIETFSKRIIFVIDISNSMKTPILVKAGTKPKRPGPDLGTPKILLAREELATCLTGMNSEVWFNIIAFETGVRQFKKTAVRASPGTIQAALRWIEKQRPRKAGGNRRRQSSDVDKNGWILGKTNTYGALAAVFGLKIDPKHGVRSTTAPSPGKKRRPKWDTCFFLSDGEPTVGVVVNIEEILQDVKRWNKTCKMIIHCIGMEHQAGVATLLNGLAQITGGKCVFVGK
ncbi:MAG: hypothetical protein CMJ83_16990 [Planctomycetes bacterium]|nr:hypothetical protein [Planctomycetota bacterium]